MVDYINATRDNNKAELTHNNFLGKVPSVLGLMVSAQLLSHTDRVVGLYGQTRQVPVYNFPRREAILMAMSYSYKLQAMVYPCRVV